jgi:hypothetical protein
MRKVLNLVFGKKANETSDLNCPHSGYYGGLINQGAYKK